MTLAVARARICPSPVSPKLPPFSHTDLTARAAGILLNWGRLKVGEWAPIFVACPGGRRYSPHPLCRRFVDRPAEPWGNGAAGLPDAVRRGRDAITSTERRYVGGSP